MFKYIAFHGHTSKIVFHIDLTGNKKWIVRFWVSLDNRVFKYNQYGLKYQWKMNEDKNFSSYKI